MTQRRGHRRRDRKRRQAETRALCQALMTELVAMRERVRAEGMVPIVPTFRLTSDPADTRALRGMIRLPVRVTSIDGADYSNARAWFLICPPKTP